MKPQNWTTVAHEKQTWYPNEFLYHGRSNRCVDGVSERKEFVLGISKKANYMCFVRNSTSFVGYNITR